MPQTRALYSVVQYVPDASRAEAANVGVVLYVPSRRWLEVRLSQSLERVRQFFKPHRHERKRIEMAMESLRQRLLLARGEFTEENDLALMAASRADAVRLSVPRVVMVEDLAADLESLYAELVGDREAALAAAVAGTSLPPRVAEVFGRLEAQHRLWRPGSITLPTTGRPFEVPIAFENGRVNYVRPESLAPGGRLDEKMMKLGFSGQLIYGHPIDNKEGKLVVLSSDPEADRDAENRFERTLEEFNVRFVRHAAANDFADEVARVAH